MKREAESALSNVMKPMKREDVTDLIVFRKMKMGLKWPEIAKKVHSLVTCRHDRAIRLLFPIKTHLHFLQLRTLLTNYDQNSYARRPTILEVKHCGSHA